MPERLVAASVAVLYRTTRSSGREANHAALGAWLATAQGPAFFQRR
jgi:hypothetical protein